MSSAVPSSYDQILYGSRPRYMCHPDCLATLGTLFGVPVAPPARCRVLEIGCAEGGNLIPMALQLPESRFLGIDLSEAQIGVGRQTQAALGLTNLELRVQSLSNLGPAEGPFDYILCHGVYSWVPQVVQDHIWAIARDNLAPHGLIYLSFNTYPGWYWKQALREMMILHVAGSEVPADRMKQARALLKGCVDAMPSADAPPLLRHYRHEMEALLQLPDRYIYHEYLETDNHPCFFSEFMARAREHGLQYLGEARDLGQPEMPVLGRPVAAESRKELVDFEQFQDFVSQRSFRKSVLVRADVPLRREPEPEVLANFHVSGLARPTGAEPDLCSPTPMSFETITGRKGSTDQPLAKVLLHLLWQAWPDSIPFETLWGTARDQLAERGLWTAELAAGGLGAVARFLLQTYLNGIVVVQVQPFRMTLRPGERPRASPLARYQAGQGWSEVSTLRHSVARISELDRVLLKELDGGRDRPGLVERLADLAQSGDIAVRREGKPLSDRDALRGTLTEALDFSLKRLAELCLLEA